MIQNFYDLVTRTLKNFQEEALKALSDNLKIIEHKFHNNVGTSNWHVKDWRSRRLWTPIGDVILNRRIYLNKHTGESRILFDEKFGLVPFLYIQPAFFPIFIKMLNKVNSYQSLSDIMGQEFSTSQISNLLKRQDVSLEPIKLREKTKLLFVNLDDIYILQHKNKKTPIRSAIAYTGTKMVNGRKTLKDKCLIPLEPGLNPLDQAEKLELILSEIYGEINQVVVVGDGARWITTIGKNIFGIKTKRYIDQFHYKKFVRDFIGRKRLREINEKFDWDYFINLKKKLAMHYLLTFVTDDDGVLDLKDGKLWSKINRWFKSFVECSKNKYPNAIEGIQSTQIARTLKNRRSFTLNNVYKILMINAAHYNKWSLSFKKTQENIFNFKNQEGIMDLLAREHSFSNIPELESSKYASVATLSYIAHWDGKN